MKSKTESVTCKHCGNEIPSTSLFCMFCGNQLVKKIEPKEKREVKVPEPKQLPSGSWFIRLRLTEGTFCITKPTYAECKAEAIAMKSRVKAPENKPKKALLRTVIDDYLKAKSNVLSPSTVRDYNITFRNQFQDVLDMDINKIDWQTAINNETKKYAPKTVKNAWGLISASLNYHKFPAPDVTLPPVPASETPFLDYEEIQAFLKGIRGLSCEIACLLGLHSLRISEILALDQTSIKDGIIHVKGAVVPDKDNKFVRKDTNKTKKSTREVPVMIPRLLEIWPKEGRTLRFQSQTTLREQIQRVCKKTGVTMISIHGLRHSFASLAYHLKWDVMTTCRIGGWSTPNTVQKIYTHLANKDKDKNVEAMKYYYEHEGKTPESEKTDNENLNREQVLVNKEFLEQIFTVLYNEPELFMNP